MISYNNAIVTSNNFTASIDMVRLTFKFKSKTALNLFMHQMHCAYYGVVTRFHAEISEKFSSDEDVICGEKLNQDWYMRTDPCQLSKSTIANFFNVGENAYDPNKLYTHDLADYSMPKFESKYYHCKSNHYGTYEHMFNIYCDLNKKKCFTVACVLQNNRETMLEGFIEFNPNKCASVELEWFLSFLNKHCSYIKLKRFDLAIDINILPSSIHIFKDERKYELIRPSVDSAFDTEYLGSRNEPGRFKKYNKKVEYNKEVNEENEKLVSELTRLEITLDSAKYSEFCRLFPKVVIQNAEIKSNENLLYFIKQYNERQKEKEELSDEFAQLPASDQVLVELLLKSDEKDIYFNRLTRDKKKKLRRFVYEDNSTTFDKNNCILTGEEFKILMSHIHSYCKLKEDWKFTRDLNEK